MQSGGGCFWLFHHFTTGASPWRAANEVSRRTQKRFRSESPSWNSPDTAEPKRMMASTFEPDVARTRVTNSLSLFSGTICFLCCRYELTGSCSVPNQSFAYHRLARGAIPTTSCCLLHRRPSFRRQNLQIRRPHHRRQSHRIPRRHIRHRHPSHRARQKCSKTKARKEASAAE